MRLLALDTALSNCAAAVIDNGEDSGCYASFGEEIGRGHAERLLDMIGEAMAETSTAFTDLDRVAVTVGPGSFTGLRVGLSVARGFGLVLGKPVVGITTLTAIARAGVRACAQTGDPADQGRPLLVVLTGKADEVYCQDFSAKGVPSGEPAVRTLADLAATVGADVSLAGSAAERVAAVLGAPQERIVSRAGYPAIRDVAELGLVAEARNSGPAPLYLRPPDAAPQTKGRIERQ